MKQRLAHILKVLLGILFIVSAILKIVDMDKFEIYIYSYHFFSLNFSFLVARAAIIAELVLGIGLASNCFHKLMWWGSVLMLLGYTGLLCYALVLGRTDNCHCFGDYLQFNPWQSIVKNVVLLALFALVYRVKGWRFKYDWIALAALALDASSQSLSSHLQTTIRPVMTKHITCNATCSRKRCRTLLWTR